jgi:hypothetical protein
MEKYMSRARDYVPSNAAHFNVFVKNIIKIVGQHTTGTGAPWAHIPADRLKALKDSALIFEDTLIEAQETPTSANRLRRNEYQAATVKILREVVNQYLRFPPVTNYDRAEMGIPNHDTIRTDHTIVTENVDYVIHLSTIRELKVEFWIQGADHRAKPEGYDGAVIIWGIRDTPPANPDELDHHTMASRTPYTLHFTEEDRGKTVYIALAWQNERGILGAWSEIKAAVIP